MIRARILPVFFLPALLILLQGWPSTMIAQPMFTRLMVSDQTQGTQSLFAYDIISDGDTDILFAVCDNTVLGLSLTDATLEIHLDQPGMVQADLFNLTGKLLHTICRQQLPAGIHKIPFTGENLGAGIYIVYLSITDKKDPERVLLKKAISVEKISNHINQ